MGVNLKLEAMKGLFDGAKTLFTIHTGNAKSMVESIQIRQKYGVTKSVIVGGSEVWLVKDFIKKHKTPIILDEVPRLPDTPEDDIDFPFRLPAMLQQEGIEFCFGFNGTMSGRNLAFSGGHRRGLRVGKRGSVARHDPEHGQNSRDR